LKSTDVNSGLTAERVHELLSYNHKTGELTWRVDRSRRVRAGDRAGHRGFDGYVDVTIDGRLYLAHRLIWLMQTGSWPAHEIDHINGIPGDNRWTNLRDVQHLYNGYNRRLSQNNRSGHKGVYYAKNAKKWHASICANRRRIFLGLHATPELAGVAYARAAEIHHGQFARASCAE
jgi:HNH endonuclease/AP2 domain